MAEEKKGTCKVKMSVPKGMEFHTPYPIQMDHTYSHHNKYYWDVNRNGRYDNINTDFSDKLDKVTEEITTLLKEKNAAYGNTALNPPQVFSKLNATEAICARLDDKISRIKNKGINDETEDTVDDLIGYLLLLKMSMNEEQ